MFKKPGESLQPNRPEPTATEAQIKSDMILDVNEGISELIKSRGASTVDELQEKFAGCCLQACDCCLQIS